MEQGAQGVYIMRLLDQVLANPDLYITLDKQDRVVCALDIRDEYVERRALLEHDGMQALLRQIKPIVLPVVEQMPVSCHPTAQWCQARCMDVDLIPSEYHEHFRRVDVVSDLVWVFVDPQMLHFRNFECILPMDHYFEPIELNVQAGNAERVSEEVELYSIDVGADDQTTELLRSLDELDLYVPPVNHQSRGGLRYIFHCKALADQLTVLMREALPKEIQEGFVHVNPVFRCNRFEAGDAPFSSHFDTPYCDPSMRHYSRYTVLLYLTSGEADGVLRVESVELDCVEMMQCVVFHQKHEHAGRAFERGRKVFLRTELIFESNDVQHNPEIGHLFNRACYLTGESVVHPELADYAHRCYDRAASARWSGLQKEVGDTPFVHKHVYGFADEIQYVTDGLSYWFPKSLFAQHQLASCATIALMDYFNVSVYGWTHRQRSHANVIEGATDGHWVDAYITQEVSDLDSVCLLADIKLDELFPSPETPDPHQCCPRCLPSAFEPTLSDDVIDLYRRAQTYIKSRVTSVPFMILGGEVCLNTESFDVRDDKIYVQGPERQPPFHFAAYNCWDFTGYEPVDYLECDAQIDVENLLVPPIPYRELDGSYHLQLYMLRNDWMVSHAPTRLPVPRIVTKGADGEWLDNARAELERAGKDPERWKW